MKDQDYEQRIALDYADRISQAKLLMPHTEKPAYCDVALVGGWCKRALGHRGDHACCIEEGA